MPNGVNIAEKGGQAMPNNTDNNASGSDGGEESKSDKGEWVRLDMKLVDWSYMDFSRTVKVDTTLGTIKEVIKKRHGGNLSSLTICKDSYQETHELRDDKLTLKQYGINGAAEKSEAPTLTLYYDFKPEGISDPLVMC